MLQETFIKVMSVLIMIGAVQGLFLALALVLMRRGNNRANLFLALFCLVASVLLFDGFLYIANIYGRYPLLTGLVWPISFLGGPAVYFYVRELTSPKRILLSWRQYLHFFPAIIATLLFGLFYPVLFSPLNARESVKRLPWAITPFGEIPYPALQLLYIVASFQMAAYAIMSFLLIRKYSADIRQSFSSLEKVNLAWLKVLFLCFFCNLFLMVTIPSIAPHLGINSSAGYLLYLGVATITFIMALKALLRPEILSQLEVAHQAELIRTDQVLAAAGNVTLSDQQGGAASPSRIKYQRTLLTDMRVAEILRQLLQLMETKKPYLELELTLTQLADMLSVSPKDLSQVLNRELKKSFFDFLNEYRVKEAARLLSSPEYGHLSILGISLDAGFNSKSAFYIAFGKYAGMTPTEFRKQLGS